MLAITKARRLRGFVGVQGGTNFVYLSAVAAYGFVELFAGYAEFLGPIVDVGGDLGVDDVWVVGTFGVFFVDGVGFVGFGCFVMFGDSVPLSDLPLYG